MMDGDHQLETKLRARPLRCLSHEARSRLMADLALDTRENTGPPTALLADSKMDQSLPNVSGSQRQSTWRTMNHRFAAIVCVAAIAGLLIVTMQLLRESDRDFASDQRDVPVDTGISSDGGESVSLESAALSPQTAIESKSFEQVVADAEVIVVATGMSFSPATYPEDEHVISWRVTRILKGSTEDSVFNAQLPTDPEIIQKWYIGREAIVMLPPEFVAGQHPYAGMYSVDQENRIKAILAGE